LSIRIKKVIQAFPKKNIDSFLVTYATDITYLTEFPSAESWLFITPAKVFYITDARYTLEAKKGLKGIEVIEHTKSIFQTLFKIVRSKKIKRIGFDSRHFNVHQFNVLKKSAPKVVKFIETNAVVEGLRAVKEEREIRYIKKALKWHHEAHQYLKRIIKPGVTEKDILLKLEQFVKRHDVGFSFDPIIASGSNSCYPHAVVTRRKIRNNEPVLVDMGIEFKGYKSDLTRMFLLGKIPKLVQHVMDCVLKAQERAICKIKPGVAVIAVDQQARNYLKGKNLAQYFRHALGHGIGLDIHEAPRLSQNDSSVLKEGMVITVEPAVYLPHKFGIRLEEMVLVTKRGSEVLSANIN